MNPDELVLFYLNEMEVNLAALEFRRKGNRFVRKSKECAQGVSILTTRVRGPAFVDIRFNVFYSFPLINQVSAFVEGVPYRKGYPTGAFGLCSLESCQNNNSHHILNENLDKNCAYELVHQDFAVISSKILPKMQSFITIEQFSDCLEDDAEVKRSLVGLRLVEWSRIAAFLCLNNTSKALEVFDSWQPISFYGKRPLQSEEIKDCRDRILSFDLASLLGHA